jgi:uncharacterized membrane protein YoaK (UPF0700 family)
MPLDFARRLVGDRRSAHWDRYLGTTLAFVAGAVNAGGFAAVQRYTSHMTGVVAAAADHLADGAFVLAGAGAAALAAFVAGAACSAVMVNFGRRHRLRSVFAAPLLLEAVLLLAFGLAGARLATAASLAVPGIVLLLCFIMGLQNALVTKLSHGEIRTTHVTGVITDIGIELGRALYWNRSPRDGLEPVRMNPVRLRGLALLAGAFFAGAVAGALAFRHVGFLATLPLAAILVLLAAVPAADDLVAVLRRRP